MRSPVSEITDERLGGVRLLLKRDDLLHPELTGNKWRKLEHNLRAAREQGATTLLTFGGAYSNHLRATAAAGHYFGFRTIGVVRGEEHLPLNDSLAYATGRGMRLTYLDRATYRRKHDPAVIAALRAQFGDFYLLPEGGSNALALRGCAEIPGELDRPYDLICCPCGTGGTLAGIAAGLPPDRRALGFAVLKGGFLTGEVRALQLQAYGAERGMWTVEDRFHFGGYARTTPELEAFRTDFAGRHGLLFDRVYVAKMMFGIFALAAEGAFAPGSTVVAVITGPPDLPELGGEGTTYSHGRGGSE